MKIIDLIKTCDTMFPNEYSLDEKLMWCNELGALLTREHYSTFEMVSTELKNGVYTLPEGFTVSDIERVIMGGRMIKKNDLAKHQIYFVQSDNGICIKGQGVGGKIKLLCRPRYKSIRNIELVGVQMSINGATVTLPYAPFETGDTLEIGIDGNVVCATIGDTKTNKDKTIEVTLDTELPAQGDCVGDIKRVITDKPVCSAPFDTMYYDFINAKICFNQRDFDTYNKHMAVFNSRLEDYDKFIIKHNSSLPDTRVSNWW